MGVKNLNKILEHPIFKPLVDSGKLLTKAGNLSQSNKTYNAIEKVLKGYEGAPRKKDTEIELDIVPSKKKVPIVDPKAKPLATEIETEQTIENIEQAIAGLEELKKKYDPLDK